jgi:polyhydroxybutyrate depolymerase
MIPKGLLVTMVVAAGAAVLIVGGPASSSATSEDKTLSSGGVAREYTLHVPAAKQAKPALVLVLHGAGNDGHSMQSLTQFDKVADAEGFVVAYPNAVGGKSGGWELGCCDARNRARNDMRFLAALIDRLAADEGIDRKRVYVTGFSLGGAMSYRLACEMSSRVAAIASGGGFEYLSKPCRPDRPVSVFEFHGTLDYYGGSCGGQTQTNQGCGLGSPGYEPSVPETNRQWRRFDRCGSKHVTSTFGTVTRKIWRDCAGSAAVQLDTAAGGTHCYPTINSCAHYDVTAAIWRFFEHRRLGAPNHARKARR